MVNAPVEEKMQSQLLEEDAALRDIIEEFVAALPDRLAELQRAFGQLNWAELTMLAHRLKGAGGSYGYPRLSELAREMEHAFREQRGERFSHWVRQLQALIAAAQAGLR